MKLEGVSVKIEEISEIERELHISVPTEAVESAIGKAVETVRRSARIKGFRKGKAPTNMVKRIYGADIESEAIRGLLDHSYTHVLDTTDLKIVSSPNIHDLEFSQGNPFTYKAKVEIFPEIQLKKYKGLKMDLVEEKVSPEIIDKEIENLRAAHARIEPLEVSRPCERGDFVVVNYEGFIDGKPLEHGKGDGVTVEIGKGAFLEGFEESLIGAGLQDEREFDCTYPVPEDESLRNELSGKTIHFKAKVLEIKRKVLPELNDDLAKDVGKFESLAELRKRIEEHLEHLASERNRRLKNERILQALMEANPLQIPNAMIERDTEYLLEDTRRTFRTRGQTFPEDPEILTKLRENFRPQAEQRVKGGLLLNAVAKSEGIEIRDEDLEQYLQDLSLNAGKPIEEVRELYKKKDSYESLRFNLMEQKTLEFLTENAKITKEIRDLQIQTDS